MTDAVLKKGRIVVVKKGEKLREGRVSEEGVRELHPVEAAYLLYTGRLRLVDEAGREVSFAELFRRIQDGNLWILFIVYTDLRKRGRKVRIGFKPNTLYIDRGSETIEMLVLEENTYVSPQEVIEFVNSAVNKGYRPMIAIVDMYGDITYYDVSKIVFKPIKRVQSV